MNIYLISQSQNDGSDTFDSAVVVAPDVETAKNMDPRSGKPMTEEDWEAPWSTWCNGVEHVEVQLIGVAAEGVEQGVICASFNAG